MNYFDKNKPMQSLIPALKDIFSSPAAFFAELPSEAFYSNPLFFASIVIFFATFAGVPFYSLALLFMVPVIWSLSLISLWLWATYMGWAVRVFAKGKLTTTNAFQISAYAAAPLALSTIPYIGAIAGLWNLYLLWVALVNRCRVSATTAIVIIAIPTLLTAGAIAMVTITLMKMVH